MARAEGGSRPSGSRVTPARRARLPRSAARGSTGSASAAARGSPRAARPVQRPTAGLAAASLMLVQGVSPRVVKETLGHNSIALTMNTYSHVLPALQREAADAVDRLLGEPCSSGFNSRGR